jgi:hypothetical protein
MSTLMSTATRETFPPQIRELLLAKSGDPAFLESFSHQPADVLRENGIEVPPGTAVKVLTAEPNTEYVWMQSEAVAEDLRQLESERGDGLLESAGPYVEVAARWWGLVFVLSPQATKDLTTGQAGISGVVGAVAAALGAVNPVLAAATGVLAAILGLVALIVASLDRGNGIYITCPWPLILVPGAWIPTPR